MRTILECILCFLLIYFFTEEQRFIDFEQKVSRLVKDIFSIARAARAQKISLKDFYYICKLCAIEEFEEKHPWCGVAERRLIKELSITIILMVLSILLSIFIIQRWG